MSTADYLDVKQGVWGHAAYAYMPNEMRPEDYILSGSNPLVMAANPLLTLIPQIQNTSSHESLELLRERLVDEIRQFELRAQHAGVPNETILGARYCLCTALDEAIALTEWGGSGRWSVHSLLVTFHNEAWGGEKFFQLLAKLSQNPTTHRNLLELLYYCLMLGFEGRYRVIENGKSQLETLKQRLLLVLRNNSPEYSMALSQHWQDKPILSEITPLPIPMWVVAVLATAIGVFSYIGMSWALGERSGRVFTNILTIKPPTVQIVNPYSAHPAQPDRLSQFLSAEIREDLLTVTDAVDRSVIVLRGDGLFESGSDVIQARYVPVLSRIADALNNTIGPILVNGFSDNVPIKTVRFPSNWELSQARADVVKKLLDQRLTDKYRVRAEGKGEANPVVPNNTPENRSRNRRVEITLLVPSTNTQIRNEE